ncbi:hypothetical protein L7G72_11525 [Xenorhabdus bovienii]|nr:hypothetical protein [Xenorhabdus bovienii]
MVQQVVLHQQRIMDVTRSLSLDTSILGKWIRSIKPKERELPCWQGRSVGRWLARRLMQECGLQSRQPGAHRYRSAGEAHAASG